jgi:hypothetical protein
MVFKMLILLGFIVLQGGFIIHSDIHRSVVDRVDYPAGNLSRDTRRGARAGGFLCAKRAEMRSRNMRFVTN